MKSKQKKQMEKNKHDIIVMLPDFINKMLLLMNSGAPAGEALCRIAEGYRQRSDARQNYFTLQLIKLYEASKQNGENIISAFCSFSRCSGVKELTRIAGILAENRDRGTDLWDKLAEQGEALWEERKRLAMTEIRLAESKMSFPLGILLMALIIMTAAPAMLQL